MASTANSSWYAYHHVQVEASKVKAVHRFSPSWEWIETWQTSEVCQPGRLC